MQSAENLILIAIANLIKQHDVARLTTSLETTVSSNFELNARLLAAKVGVSLHAQSLETRNQTT